MIRIFTLAISLCVSLSSLAQINRPRTSPTSTTPPPAPVSRGVEASPTPSGDGPIAIRQASDIQLKLLRVEGNAADQQVTLHWVMNNPKANTDVTYHGAYAVDLEGDEYNDAENQHGTTLYTDVPKKGFRIIKGVPSKIQQLKFAKFNFYSQATGQWTVVEFRDLKIDWK